MKIRLTVGQLRKFVNEQVISERSRARRSSSGKGDSFVSRWGIDQLFGATGGGSGMGGGGGMGGVGGDGHGGWGSYWPSHIDSWGHKAHAHDPNLPSWMQPGGRTHQDAQDNARHSQESFESQVPDSGGSDGGGSGTDA